MRWRDWDEMAIVFTCWFGCLSTPQFKELVRHWEKEHGSRSPGRIYYREGEGKTYKQADYVVGIRND